MKIKNPCEQDCILRVVCTEPCDAKKNYETLLKTAIDRNSTRKTNNGYLYVSYSKYCEYCSSLTNHKNDLLKIKTRRRSK